MSMAACTLGRRSIYLLPTREGFWFLGTLLVLLLAAVNYGNGLAYALTFLLAAMATLSSAVSQRNLLGITVHEGAVRAAFAGSPVGFRIILVNATQSPRFGITVAVGKTTITTVDLAALEQRCIDIPKDTVRRGRVSAPIVRLYSHYPYGLLRAFSRRLKLEDPGIAYPKPAHYAALPAGLGFVDASPESVGARPNGGGDFHGLTPLREGENPHHIHWKAVAAGRGLLVKRFAGLADREIWLTLPVAGELEERLGRVCRQALSAEREGYRYGLVLDETRIPPDNGRFHLERCLHKLALYSDHGD